MKKKISLIIFAVLVSFNGIGQNKLALNLGYDYMQKHSGFVGVDYRIDGNEGENKHGPLNIGLGTYLYGENGKFALSPEAHLTKTWKHFLLTEISVSTKNVKPSVGLTFFNLAHLKFGYSFPFRGSDFKGFSLGFHILIGRAPFYDEIKVF